MAATLDPVDVLEALERAPDPTHRRHDYSQGNAWGHACYWQVQDNGLTVSGHLILGERPELGDWLILPQGDKTTRYRITGLQWMGDPEDMWEFSATFDPRSAIPTHTTEEQPR